jgi:hypothetical protein
VRVEDRALDGTQQESLHRCGIRNSAMPARICQSRSRSRFRCTCLERRPPSFRLPTPSAAGRQSRASPRDDFIAVSRRNVASEPFASSSREAVSWSIMVGSAGQCCGPRTNPTQVDRSDRLLHHDRDTTHSTGETRRRSITSARLSMPCIYATGERRLTGMRSVGDLSGARTGTVRITGRVDGDHHQG